MTVQETLANLVSINSVSSRSNAEIISYLAKRCEAAGFSVTQYVYADESGVAALRDERGSSRLLDAMERGLDRIAHGVPPRRRAGRHA